MLRPGNYDLDIGLEPTIKEFCKALTIDNNNILARVVYVFLSEIPKRLGSKKTASRRDTSAYFSKYFN